jgi:hypothetical protein
VTLVEGKGVRRPSVGTLEVLVCTFEKFRRKYMEHIGDPGREDHPELGLVRSKKPRALPCTRAKTANEGPKLKFETDLGSTDFVFFSSSPRNW